MVALNSQKSNTSLTFVRKHLNIQEAFSSEQTHNKTENANLSSGEPDTPPHLKLSVGVFGPLINPYWLKEATTAIKILQSLGIYLQEILRILCCHYYQGRKPGLSFHHSLHFVINVDFKQSKIWPVISKIICKCQKKDLKVQKDVLMRRYNNEVS